MSSFAQRASILAIGAATLAGTAAPAGAQADRTAVVDILIECAKIDDPTARLACYDNNIRQAGGTPRAAAPAGALRGGPAPVAPTSSQQFGIEDVRTPQAVQSRPAEVDEIQARVASISPRQPGIYLVTLEDGAQWLFAEGVSQQFRLPRRGDTIEIERGSLGSFLMQIDRQKAVPVRRIR